MLKGRVGVKLEQFVGAQTVSCSRKRIEQFEPSQHKLRGTVNEGVVCRRKVESCVQSIRTFLDQARCSPGRADNGQQSQVE